MKLVWLIVVLSSIHIVKGSAPERRLLETLLQDYDVRERPVANLSDPVPVFLQLSVQQIVGIDMKNQMMTVNMWLKYTWKDYKLTWQPAFYEGVTDVRFKSTDLWKPDVLMYNSVDDDFDSTYPTNLVVYNDGTVNWIPPGIFQFSCKIDITWFPFDQQLCFAKFGSWSYDMTKLDLQSDPAGGFDYSDYMLNGEWLVYSWFESEVNRSLKYYECCPDNPYPSLYYNFYLRRRPLFYAFNLIMPCLLITVVALAGYTLPSDSGEMIGLRIYFSLCSVVICGSVCLTVLVINLHRRSPDFQQMGYTARAIYLHWLPWLVRLRRPGRGLVKWADLPHPFKAPPAASEDSEETEPLRRSTVDVAVGTSECGSINSQQSLKKDANGNIQPIYSDLLYVTSKLAEEQTESKMRRIMDATSGQQDMCVADEAMILTLMRIYRRCKFITRRADDADEVSQGEQDWIFAGMAIEKLCLITLPIFLTISTIYVFYSAPYF